MKRSLLENVLRLFVICAVVTIPLSIGCGDAESADDDTDMPVEP